MEALSLRVSPIHSRHTPTPSRLGNIHSKKLFSFNFKPVPTSSFSTGHINVSKFKLFSTMPSSVSTEPADPTRTELETQFQTQNNKFDWYSQWYPIMPVCDLDKRVPHGKKVMGIDVVVWWDRNESSWKVFDDTCPHRLAPLSEGRIDQWGRLQCSYHGWCFNGVGDCKLIPQAPPDGPPFQTFKKACATVYPSTVQNDIVWFWPNKDPKFKDILKDKRPPYIPEMDDPSYTSLMGSRDMPYGYEVLIENLMDPAHVPYAHFGIMRPPQPENKVDREGGKPLEMSLQKLDINGFIANQDSGSSQFNPPCVYRSFLSLPGTASDGTKKPSVPRRMGLIFICIPVSPGNSRVIWAFPRNFANWLDKIVPRWIFHLGQNLILDSDLYLLHVEERRIKERGTEKWLKACFVPAKSDAEVVGFRKWFNKYADSQIDWRGKFSGALPPTPPREQLMDRYWSHVVNCRTCSAAHKGFKVLEVVLKLVSISLVGIVAATKQSMTSMAVRTTVVLMAILCFAASKWLGQFIYKNFHFHDYNHGRIFCDDSGSGIIKLPTLQL